MEVYRLARLKYTEKLSGKGAALQGGRWNSPGIEIIYTASNRSLAMAEVAVHMTLATLPIDYQMLTIYIPDDVPTDHITINDLPVKWNKFPHESMTQSYGNNFILHNQHAVLKVPSAVTPGDTNILINPFYRDFTRIKIIDCQPFPFDQRIFS